MSGIAWLNSLAPEQAAAEFQKCCGSRNWAQFMTDQRPFADLPDLLSKADSNWWSLSKDDWIEAFRSHPKIGEKKAEQTQSAEAKAWSEQEQSGTCETTQEMMAALADGNREYLGRFGYIFIVCATGKSAEEMLTILRERLDREPAEELWTAAAEQNKITQLRLRKLIDC